MGFMSFIFLIAIIAAIFYVLKKSSSNPQPKKHTSNKPNANALVLENVETGGVIHFQHVGPEMEDFDVTITAKHQYKEGGYSWFELEGDRGEDKVWIEIENDDELEIGITLKRLKLKDLGVSKKELEKIDDDEEGELTYQGTTYYYEDSGQATYYRDCDPEQADTFYYWDFEADDEKQFIGVEKWQDGSFEASYSVAVKPSQVTVYSLKA